MLVDNVLPFWEERVIDREGGYLLAFDVRGQLRRGLARRIVTQARTMWFFSRLARSRYWNEARTLIANLYQRAFGPVAISPSSR